MYVQGLSSAPFYYFFWKRECSSFSYPESVSIFTNHGLQGLIALTVTIKI